MRTVIAEVLTMNEAIREPINKNESMSEIKKVLKNLNIKFIISDGVEKVLKGVSSIEEVLRVAHNKL